MPADLALFGGKKAFTGKVAGWPIFDNAEERALLQVFRSGKWFYGDKVAEFEEKYAAYQDAKYGISCVNGTAAIEIACVAAGVGAGTEVITSPYTFVATAAAPLRANAVPVFVDIEQDTVNIDPAKIEAAITPRTKAIIPVHFGGLPCDMDKINRIARKHKLVVIEDAAHCWGTKWKGKGAGALGDLGTFSFQQSKNMTSGEGGMILSDSKRLAESARSYSNVGRNRTGGWYEHYRLGSNYSLTEFQAAILIEQLKRLPRHVTKREDNGTMLSDALREIPGIQVFRRDKRVTQRSWHTYNFRFLSEDFDGVTRDQFLRALKAEGVPCSTGYPFPLYKNPMFQRAMKGPSGCPVTCPYLKSDPVDYRELYLPVVERTCREYVGMPHQLLLGTKRDMKQVITAFRKTRDSAKRLRDVKAGG